MSGGTPRPGPAGLAAAARLGPVDPLLTDRSDKSDPLGGPASTAYGCTLSAGCPVDGMPIASTCGAWGGTQFDIKVPAR